MKTKTVIAIGVGVGALALWLREQRKKEPTINYVDKLPFKNFSALTLPPFGIYIRSEHQANERLLKHELMHWQQYQRMGLVPFYFNYLKEYATVGYDKHSMEIEARNAAGEEEYCILNYTECIRNGKAKTVFNPNFRR